MFTPASPAQRVKLPPPTEQNRGDGPERRLPAKSPVGAGAARRRRPGPRIANSRKAPATARVRSPIHPYGPLPVTAGVRFSP